MSLGQDFEADAMDAFSGELYDATLVRTAESAFDVDNPTAAPTGGTTTHTCEGIAFEYEQRWIDGSRVIRGDYRVVILRGSIDVIPKPSDAITIPPPGQTTPKRAIVITVEAVTEAFLAVHVRGAPA